MHRMLSVRRIRYRSGTADRYIQAIGYLRMSSRVDAVASRVESAMRMKTVIGSLGKIGQQMDMAMQSMDLEKISQGTNTLCMHHNSHG